MKKKNKWNKQPLRHTHKRCRGCWHSYNDGVCCDFGEAIPDGVYCDGYEPCGKNAMPIEENDKWKTEQDEEED